MSTLSTADVFEKLAAMRGLDRGWDGYDAPPIANIAVDAALWFIPALIARGLHPTRVVPSAVGAVAISIRRDSLVFFGEIWNDHPFEFTYLLTDRSISVENGGIVHSGTVDLSVFLKHDYVRVMKFLEQGVLDEDGLDQHDGRRVRRLHDRGVLHDRAECQDGGDGP